MRPVLLLILLLFPTVVDAAPVDSIRRSISSGHCREAVVDIQDAQQTEDGAELWRLLGDAHRCLGEPRPAVLAYRRYVDDVGADPAVEGLIAGLRERLGRLLVAVQADRGEVLSVDVVLPDGSRERGTRTQTGAWLVEDLEPSRPTSLLVRGLGLAETRTRAPGPPVGGQASVEVHPAWVGVATITLDPGLPDGVHVELPGPEGPVILRPGEPLRVNAGDVPVEAVSERGRVGIPLSCAPEDACRLNATPWIPTRVSVRGVPTGSTARVFLEAVEPPLERQVETAVDLGIVDPDWGVQVGPMLVIDSLVGGAGTLVVSHPSLGVMASELLLEAGADNAAEVDWQSLPRAMAVRSEYGIWRSHDRAARKKALTPAVIGVAAGAAGALCAVLGMAAAGAQQQTLADAQTQAVAGVAHEAGATGWYDVHQGALEGQRAAAGLAVGGAILSVAGFTVTGVFGLKAQQAAAKQGAWTPP
jgi:hypothetical protein